MSKFWTINVIRMWQKCFIINYSKIVNLANNHTNNVFGVYGTLVVVFFLFQINNICLFSCNFILKILTPDLRTRFIFIWFIHRFIPNMIQYIYIIFNRIGIDACTFSRWSRFLFWLYDVYIFTKIGVSFFNHKNISVI